VKTVFLLATAAALMAEPAEYRFEPHPGGRFALEVHKTGLMSGKKHLFVFDRYSGVLHYDPAAPGSARIEFAIEAASIVVKDDWVSDKDRVKIREEAEKNMLDIARFKEIRFNSTSVAKTDDGGYRVQGELAIRNQSKPVTVLVKVTPEAGGALRFDGAAVVRLKDYGLKPPSAALGLVGTKNEMDAAFTLLARPAR
jgi:polyisoprenoid-binding protein YceI